MMQILGRRSFFANLWGREGPGSAGGVWLPKAQVRHMLCLYNGRQFSRADNNFTYRYYCGRRRGGETSNLNIMHSSHESIFTVMSCKYSTNIFEYILHDEAHM